MTNTPALFSFAILSYHNYRYLFEALDSLFIQTYPNIELLIANDGSPDFNEKELREYIDANKGKNIVRVVIENRPQNVGTVKNIEDIRQKAQGEYIMYMAADDALYDEKVLSAYAQTFEELGPKAYVLTGMTALCGEKLEETEEYVPSEGQIKKIKEFTPQQMFSYLSHTLIIPTTSTCYRKKVYEVVGPYDTQYAIIEDAPFFIKLARLGIKIYWVDHLIGAKHRDGGISHGNTLNLSEGYRKYRKDEITVFQKEILPYKKNIFPNDRKRMLKKWDYIYRQYDKQFVRPYLTKKERMQRRIKHAPAILRHMLQRLFVKVWQILNGKELSNMVISVGLMGGAAAAVMILGRSVNAAVFLPSLFSLAYTVTGAAFVLYLILQILRLIDLLWRALLFILLGRENLK